MPGELGFCPIKLLEIIRQASSGELLLPCPARKSLSIPSKYVHLDGRHRILHKKMSGEKTVNLFLAEYQNETMTTKHLPDLPKYKYDINNHYIALRWVDADRLAGKLQVRDYNEYYEKLVEEYPFMENVGSFLKFAKRKNQREQRMIYGLPGIIRLDRC